MPALAHGRRGGDRQLFLLARAAGITHPQIATAFKADTNLKTYHTNLKNARQAMIACLLSGANCGSQISTYASDSQLLTNEKLSVWNGLFEKTTSKQQAAAQNVLSELQQIQSERKSIFQQVFGSQAKGDSSESHQ